MNIPQFIEDDVWEMLILDKRQTGLPMIVCLADSISEYGPGIYFLDSYASQITDNELSSMVSIDITTLKTSEELKIISNADLLELQNWIEQNKIELLLLYSGSSYWDIVKNLHPVKSKLNRDVLAVLTR